MKNFLTACAVIAALPLSAGAAIPLAQALELCRAEQNALRRLSCYDAISNNVSQTDSKPTTALPTQANAKANAAVNNKQADDFGLEHKQREDSTEQLNVTVVAVSYTPRKELIVEFDNGQRWRQVGSDFYSIASGQQHQIKRGVLNSFFLANDNNNRTIRIRREQ